MNVYGFDDIAPHPVNMAGQRDIATTGQGNIELRADILPFQPIASSYRQLAPGALRIGGY
jgi:hypothetical protein